MATFSNFFPSAKLDFAVSESLVNGPIINFSASVTVTSSLSASSDGSQIIWGASSYGVTGFNTLTLVDQTISGSNLQAYIEITKQYVGINIGAICTDVLTNYISSSNLIALFASNHITLDTSFIGTPTLTVTPTSLSDFRLVKVGETSPDVPFVVSGSYLINDIYITAPTGFLISDGTGTYFDYTSGSWIVSQSGGSASATMYATFAPITESVYDTSYTIASDAATTIYVLVTGTGTP